MRVLYVAYGTRGDVQPVLLVALRHASSSPSGDAGCPPRSATPSSLLAASTLLSDAHAMDACDAAATSSPHAASICPPCVEVMFITHASHAGWMAHVMARSGVDASHVTVEFVEPHAFDLSSTPSDGYSNSSAGASSVEAGVAAYQSSDAFRVLRSLLRGRASLSSYTSHSNSVCAVLFNLFALEMAAWAEACGVPAIALSPYMMPHAHPTLAQVARFVSAPGVQVNAHAFSSNAVVHACLNATLDVHVLSHWMHVLYNSARWAVLRASLELPPEPQLQRPIPLLYGFPAALLSTDVSLPQSITCVGFWREAYTIAACASSRHEVAPVLCTLGSLPAAFDVIARDVTLWLARLEAVARITGVPMLVCCNGFDVRPQWEDGSDAPEGAGTISQQHSAGTSTHDMSAFSPGRRSRAVMEDEVMTAASAVVTRKRPRPSTESGSPTSRDEGEETLLSKFHGWNSNEASAMAARGANDRSWLFTYRSTRVRYTHLLQACAAVVHHAGCGMSCDALYAAVPQAPMPVMFDQPAWAAALHELGVATAPISYDDFISDTNDAVAMFASGLQAIVQADSTARLRARAVAAVLAREPDAAVQTAHIISAYLLASDGDCVHTRTPTLVTSSTRPTTTTALVSSHARERSIALNDMHIRACGMTATTTSASEAVVLVSELWDDTAYFHNGVPLPWRAAYARTSTASPETRADALIVNVGAHVGLLELWVISQLRETFAPSARRPHVYMLSVEPVNLAFDLFDWNMRQHASEVRDSPLVVSGVALRACTYTFWDISLTIICVCVALGDAAACASVNGELHLVVYPHMLGSSTGKPLEKLILQAECTSKAAFDDAYMDRVRLTTLSELLAAAPAPVRHTSVDMLKVDVEGFELEVLRGLTPSDWNRVASLSIETHDVGERMGSIAALLVAAGGFTITTRRPVTPSPPSNVMVHAFRHP